MIRFFKIIFRSNLFEKLNEIITFLIQILFRINVNKIP